MKRIIVWVAILVMSISYASAQNYMVVNSEKIFKSIPEYNTAIQQLDALAKQYQAEIDKEFEGIEMLYQNYVESRDALSREDAKAYEQLILEKEKAANQKRESVFGKEGSLMKKRQEVIRPIQQRVFSAIEAHAQKMGADLVLDSSNNPTLLYSNPKVEQTSAIIELVK